MLLEFCSHQFCMILPQEWVSHPESGFLIRGGGKPFPPPSPSIDPLTFCLGVAQESPCQAMASWCQTSKPQC